MAAIRRVHEVRDIFSRISSSYDLNNTLLSAGLHWRWKRLLLAGLSAAPGALVLDLCTGTGDLLTLLPRSTRAVGVDFCPQMLMQAARKLEQRDAKLIQADALRLPFPDRCFDGVTVAFGLRNLADLDVGFAEARRVLKPGGRFCALEFGQPEGRVLRPLFLFYSRFVLPLIGGAVSGDRDAYAYLHESLWQFPCGGLFCRRLTGHGFQMEQVRELCGGIAYLYAARAV